MIQTLGLSPLFLPSLKDILDIIYLILQCPSFPSTFEDQGEVAIIVNIDPDTSFFVISSYAPITPTNSISSNSIILHLYLSQCTNSTSADLNLFDSMAFISADIPNPDDSRAVYKEQPMIVTRKGVVTKKYKPVARR